MKSVQSSCSCRSRSVDFPYCLVIGFYSALLTFSKQAQLKETIEKYGPVRQPVRETTLKILRCDVHDICSWHQLARCPVSLIVRWVPDCNFVSSQVGL